MRASNDRRRQAVALHYEAAQADAPRVVAKGAGHLADRIVALAQEHGVPVREDPDLTALLAQLDVDAHIPPELYKAVAEVLAFVYRLSSKGR